MADNMFLYSMVFNRDCIAKFTMLVIAFLMYES